LHEGLISADEIRTWGDGALEIVSQYCSLFENDPDFNIEGISSSAPTEYSRAYWSDRRRSYNYLKHADRDANGLLDEATINNEDTILQALICSQQLNMKHTQEKHFFYCAMIASGKMQGDDEKPLDLELLMSGMSEEEIKALGRKNLCHASFQDDDIHLERAADQMKENSENWEGRDIQFFKQE
jgi:hypothetical protein